MASASPNGSRGDPAASPATDGNLESLGWEELVALKRKLAGELKELTDRIVDIDKNRFHSISTSIKEQKNVLESMNERFRQVRSEIEKKNSELLAVSEKISQSKNFISVMEARLPSEKEEDLQSEVQAGQSLIDGRQYRSEREKSEIMSKVKEASMKLEAIKATRTIKEQFAQLMLESTAISRSIMQLNEERDMLRSKMAEASAAADRLYDDKRGLASERAVYLAKYDEALKQFDSINARLDSMSQMRKKQRQEYGFGLPSDALFKVKEEAKKKLESGSKLSFEELKLLYGEKD